MADVNARAYELYEAAGGEDGLRDEHWAQAEASVAAPAAGRAPEGQPAGPGARLLVLVRHARRLRLVAKAEKSHRMEGWPEGARPLPRVEDDDGKSRKSAWKKTLDIALALAERLEAEHVDVTHILHSPHEVARQTALVYAAVLARRRPAELAKADWLDPDRFSRAPRKETDGHFRELWALAQPPGARQAIVLVGHQPQLTELADVALRGAVPPWWRWILSKPTPLPLGGSEAACLRLDPRPQLRWLLTEKSGALVAEVKDKLKSKVETAKFFLGALAVNSGLLINTGLWSTAGPGSLAVLAVGGVLVFTALALSVTTLLGYDALNMPPEFWVEGAGLDRQTRREPGAETLARGSVLRPPSEASVVLFYEMVNIWNRFFIPALIVSVAGVACFFLTLGLSRLDVLLAPSTSALASTPPVTPPPAPMHWGVWAVAALLLAAVACLVAAYYRHRGPRLGFED